MRTTRRHFLEIAAAGATAAAFGLPSLPSIAHAATESPAEFFLFIIALGGWDVTLWADPRNELKGIVHPAATSNTDTSQLKLWADAPLGEGDKTFQLVRPARSNLVFGPGIGDL